MGVSLSDSVELLSEELSEEDAAERLTMTVTMADAVPLETVMEVAPVPTAVITPPGADRGNVAVGGLIGELLGSGRRLDTGGQGAGGTGLSTT